MKLNDVEFGRLIVIQTHPKYLEHLAAKGAESYIEALVLRHPFEAHRLAQITPSLAEFMKTLYTYVEDEHRQVSIQDYDEVFLHSLSGVSTEANLDLPAMVKMEAFCQTFYEKRNQEKAVAVKQTESEPDQVPLGSNSPSQELRPEGKQEPPTFVQNDTETITQVCLSLTLQELLSSSNGDNKIFQYNDLILERKMFAALEDMMTIRAIRVCTFSES